MATKNNNISSGTCRNYQGITMTTFRTIIVLLTFTLSAQAMTANQIIALTICLEGSTQSWSGRELIASSIYNRADTITAQSLVAVCLKPKAYSCWNNRTPNIKLVQEICRTKRGRMMWENAMLTARAMVNVTYRPVTEATHYHTTNIKPAWSNEMEHVVTHKKHRFYKES